MSEELTRFIVLLVFAAVDFLMNIYPYWDLVMTSDDLFPALLAGLTPAVTCGFQLEQKY